LLQDIVQILDWSMSTAAAQDSFLFHSWNCRSVEARMIGVDYSGLFDIAKRERVPEDTSAPHKRSVLEPSVAT